MWIRDHSFVDGQNYLHLPHVALEVDCEGLSMDGIYQRTFSEVIKVVGR